MSWHYIEWPVEGTIVSRSLLYNHGIDDDCSRMHSSAVCEGLWNPAASDSDQQDEEEALQVRKVTHTLVYSHLLVWKRKGIRLRNYWTHAHTHMLAVLFE